MYFNEKKVSIYYEKYGSGEKSIIILPGWGDTRKTFYYLINFLKDNFTIYIIDYPGFGNSPLPKTDLTIYDYANIVNNFIKKLEITAPIIIAHSFGGRIATILTGHYKEKINKLILIDAAGIKPKKSLFQKIKQLTYKILKKLLKLLPSKVSKKLSKKITNIFSSTDYLALPDSMKKTFKNIVNEDLKHYLKNIDIETLIIWGKLDKDTPLKDGIYMNKKIKNSALIVYQKSSHFSYLEYPYLTYSIISEFLKQKNS